MAFLARSTESKEQPVDEDHGDNPAQPEFSTVIKANRGEYYCTTVTGKKRTKKKVIVGDSAQDTRIRGVAKKAVCKSFGTRNNC